MMEIRVFMLASPQPGTHESQIEMPKSKHIGLVIFSLCSFLSAKIALLEPEPHEITTAEQRWGTTQSKGDTLGFLRGFRFYIYGAGVLGLLIMVEDYYSEASAKRKKAAPKPPFTP